MYGLCHTTYINCSYKALPKWIDVIGRQSTFTSINAAMGLRVETIPKPMLLCIPPVTMHSKLLHCFSLACGNNRVPIVKVLKAYMYVRELAMSLYVPELGLPSCTCACFTSIFTPNTILSCVFALYLFNTRSTVPMFNSGWFIGLNAYLCLALLLCSNSCII